MSKLSEKLDNFWYHYKWHTIVTLFFVVVFGICIGQMASKDKVDAYIMYAGPSAFFASEIEEMQSAFETVMPDLNGDGKKVVYERELPIIELIISIFFLIPWWISSIENFSAKISIALFDSPDTMAIL